MKKTGHFPWTTERHVQGKGMKFYLDYQPHRVKGITTQWWFLEQTWVCGEAADTRFQKPSLLIPWGISNKKKVSAQPTLIHMASLLIKNHLIYEDQPVTWASLTNLRGLHMALALWVSAGPLKNFSWMDLQFYIFCLQSKGKAYWKGIFWKAEYMLSMLFSA